MDLAFTGFGPGYGAEREHVHHGTIVRAAAITK